jgi:hypothetical protein
VAHAGLVTTKRRPVNETDFQAEALYMRNVHFLQFANSDDIAQATTLATNQLNSRASPWIWGRTAPPTRFLRRRYVYLI